MCLNRTAGGGGVQQTLDETQWSLYVVTIAKANVPVITDDQQLG